MTKRILSISALVLGFICTFFLGHIDSNTITTWGYDLLDCLFSGSLSDFPAYTYSTHDMATNYPLFDNVITALVLLPIYLINRLLHLSAGMVVFDLWMRLFIFIIQIINAILFYGILRSESIDENHSFMGAFILFTSAVSMLSILPKGQLDALCLLFILLAYRDLIAEKYLPMSVFFGLSFLVKPFPILIAAPVFILLISKLDLKALIYAVISLLPFGANKLITTLLMPEYSYYNEITSKLFKATFGSSRVEELFALKLGSISVFWFTVIVLCGTCFYLARMKKVSRDMYVIMPFFMYAALAAFVSCTTYWYISVIPMVIYLGIKSLDSLTLIISMLFNSISVIVFTVFAEKIFTPSKMYSVIDLFKEVALPKEIVLPFEDAAFFTNDLLLTTFVATLIIPVIACLLKNAFVKDSDRTFFEVKNTEILLLSATLIPMTLYIIILYFTHIL